MKKTSKNSARRASRIAPTDRIIKLVRKNPRRPGSHGYNSFSLIRSRMTVAEYLEAGGRATDLRWDVMHGFAAVKRNGEPKG